MIFHVYFHCLFSKCSKEEQELVVRPPGEFTEKNISTCWYVRCVDESVRDGT